VRENLGIKLRNPRHWRLKLALFSRCGSVCATNQRSPCFKSRFRIELFIRVIVLPRSKSTGPSPLTLEEARFVLVCGEHATAIGVKQGFIPGDFSSILVPATKALLLRAVACEGCLRFSPQLKGCYHASTSESSRLHIYLMFYGCSSLGCEPKPRPQDLRSCLIDPMKRRNKVAANGSWRLLSLRTPATASSVFRQVRSHWRRLRDTLPRVQPPEDGVSK